MIIFSNILPDFGLSKRREPWIRVCWFILVFLGVSFSVQAQQPSIFVFAGRDTSICVNASLNISSLQARITGSVTNGFWFTSGDGLFLPGNQSNGQFSSTLQYQPGVLDRLHGFFDLTLVSDDPDGIGPMVQVSDLVRIFLMSAPPLTCNNNINISLGADCTQLITPSLVSSHLIGPAEYYQLELRINNQLIANNTVNVNHIGKTVQYKLSHLCGNTFCHGTFSVFDYAAPELLVKSDTISCLRDVRAEVYGLPIPSHSTFKRIGVDSFRVLNFDGCGPTLLTFRDVTVNLNCQGGLDRRIDRTWTARDSFGNMTSALERIVLRTEGLSQVTFPANFDGPNALLCEGDWQRLPSGAPHPIVTGTPFIGSCRRLETTYSDTSFPACSGSRKILRQWQVINWCNAQSLQHNQIIEVADRVAPVFTCVDSLVVSTQAYDCISEQFLIPVPTQIQDCGTTTSTLRILDAQGVVLSGAVFQQGNQFFARDLALSNYFAEWTVTDACGNYSTCQVPIFVKDNQVPFMLCIQNTKVSLGSDGRGRIFPNSLDAGSWDNCGISGYAVRRMNLNCGGNTDFGPQVDFCCADIGADVQVSLRVTDPSGNSNTCMVMVHVEDKLPPVITCPPSLTISCDQPLEEGALQRYGTVVSAPNLRNNIQIFDAYNQGVVGQDGLAIDNCSVQISEQAIFELECSVGRVQRIFTATDAYGNSQSCTQIITVRNPDPFNVEDIRWPRDTTIFGCVIGMEQNFETGRPIFLNSTCNLVSATHEDQIFTIANGACQEILRTWTVIDWCQFNQNQQTGLWSRIQVIKINNNIAPVIQNLDTVQVCNYSENCGLTAYQESLVGTDECTPNAQLRWTWELDLFNDQSINQTGNSNQVQVNLPNGSHRLRIRLEDQCGNFKIGTKILVVRDCKKPTPRCTSTIVTAVMSEFGEVSIYAGQFDFGSFDNCTMEHQLRFSFSSEASDESRTIRCEDIPNGVSADIPLEMWVTDEAGNQDYCNVTIRVQDNQNICPDNGGTTMISGRVTSFNQRPIHQAEVRLKLQESDETRSRSTNVDGEFQFDQIPMLGGGSVRSVYPGFASQGLTTLDIVLIQQHILGINRFPSPYQLIAADVNNSRTITTSDIVAIRKVVLGIDASFPNGQPNWKFLSKDYVFQDPLRPWNFPDSIGIASFQDVNKEFDFIGLKLGDVNGSFSQIRNEDPEVSGRSANFVLNQTPSKDGIRIFPNQSGLFLGFQFSIELEHADIEVQVPPHLLDRIHMAKIGRVLTVSGSDPYGLWLEKGESLLTIMQAAPVSLSDEVAAEIYDIDHQIMTLSLYPMTELANEKVDCGVSVLNEDGMITLRTRADKLQIVGFELFGLDGRKLMSKSWESSDIEKSVRVDRLETGLYLLRIQTGVGYCTSKVFIP